MRKSLALFSFLVLLTVQPARAQDPQLLEKFDDWTIFLSTTEAGDFDLCLATKTYGNGEVLAFYSDAQTFTMSFLLERWQLDARDAYDISIRVDEGTAIPATALAGEDKKAVFLDLELSPYMIEIVGGSTLYLITGAGTLAFDLSGAAAALNSMATCALDNAPDPTP